MNIKTVAIVCCFGLSLALTGCDPKEMVNKRVPAPVKEILSSDQGGKKAGTSKRGDTSTGLEIISPEPDSIFPSGQEIVFRARVQGPSGDGSQPGQITWTLRGGQHAGPLGRGQMVRKTLERGQYQVQAVFSRDQVSIEKTVRFRVADQIFGRIVTYEGDALPEAKLSLSEVGGVKPLFEAQSAKDGQFAIEIPPKGSYVLSASKAGYSFLPCSRIVQYASPPVNQDFKAASAEITAISFTETGSGERTVDLVCPLEERYVRFAIRSEPKSKSIEAQLVRVEEGVERSVSLDKVSEDTDATGEPRGEKVLMKVLVPSALVTGPPNASYRLRVTVADEKERTYAAETAVTFDYDLQRCFRKTMADGIEHQRKGRLEQAINTYRLLSKYQDQADDRAQFAPLMRQSTFNRGLAYLAMAIEKPADGIERITLLNKAAADFQSLLESNKSDLDAMLFLGWTYALAGNTGKAEEFYSRILDVEPLFAGARELRARARLEWIKDSIRKAKHDISKLKVQSENVMELSKKIMGRLNNLEKPVKERMLGAVDDYTEALTSQAADQSVRDTRRELLNMVHKLNESEANIADLSNQIRNLMAKKEYESDLAHPLLAVDVTKIQIRDLDKVLDPAGRIRQ